MKFKKFNGFIHKDNSLKIKRTVSMSLCAMSFACVFAQSGVVNVNLQNASIKDLFRSIEKQTSYRFSYREVEVKGKTGITLNAKEENLENLLKRELSKFGLKYQLSGNKIVIIPASGNSNSKPVEVKGKVLDSNGDPVIGATVMERGTTNGTITDFDGNFILEVSEGAPIEISYIGYQSQFLNASSDKILSVVLKDDTQALDEVVVVGYGTQTKSSLSSSIVEIKGSSLTNLPVTDISRALDSYVPGVTASGTMSEKPGESQALKIRGENSINNSEPLVLIDGIEGDMGSLNPNDIESISVLKDAASTAIYGARAAGGVILVTTKMGNKEQKVRVTYSGSYTNKSATRLPEKLDGLSYVEYRIKAEEASGKNSVSNHPDILAALKDPNIDEIPSPARPLTHFYGTASVDHIKEALGSANMHDHSVSVTGGNKLLSFLISGGFMQDDALFRYGDFGYKKYNFRTNLNFQFTDNISLSTRIGYISENTDQPIDGWDGVIKQAYKSQPSDPVKWKTTGDWGGNNDGNAIQDLVEGGHNVNKSDRLDISGNLQVKFLKGLTWNTIIGGSLVNDNITKEYKTITRYSVKPDVPVGQKYFPNSLEKEQRRTLYRNIQSYINYEMPTLKNNNLKVMLGASYEDSSTDYFYSKRQEFLSNDLMNSVDMGIGDQYSGGNITEWAISSVFGRLNYNYNQKYYLEASFRSDGSSRFVSGKRWGFFPSVSASWRISEENFMKKQNLVSDLKLRASWGNTGNQNAIGLYDYLAQLKIGDSYYPLGTDYSQNKFVIQNKLASVDRTWERLEVLNMGLDFGLLRNKLTGSFEYYIKRNNNMLIPVKLPSVIGLEVPTFNSGELKVWGWEASLKWQDSVNDKFNYSINFAIQDSNNKIVEFAGSKNIVSGQQNIEGYPIGSYLGYETDGLFQSKQEVQKHAFQHVKNDAGDVKYIDKNGDKKINDKDLVYLGNIRPRYVYNIGINMEYAGWDLEMLFDGVGKKLINLNTNLAAPVDFARFKGQTDAWTPENPDAEWPRIYQNDSWNWWISDRTLHNAAYFSMKNLQLGYTFPKKWMSKINIERLRIYANIRNPFIIDNYVEYMDPRNNAYNNYPVLRSYTIGLNLTF